MQVITEYLSMNYFVLLMLLGLTVIRLVNRKIPISGVQYFWGIIGLTFLLTVFQYMEYWSDTYSHSISLLYIKTSAIYCLYPLIALLELQLISPVKRRWLLIVPYILFAMIEIADLFKAGLTYSFTPDGHFASGPLRPLPLLMDSVYVIILTFFSLRLVHKGTYAKFFIVIFMAASTILTAFLEVKNIVSGLTEEITALDVMVYYFYLAAIQHNETQDSLHKKELELEKSKLTLLLTQIKPHFINNSLLTIHEFCYEDPEKAAELIEHFAIYLRTHIMATDRDAMIPFTKEIESIKEYLLLEYADQSKLFTVEYDLQATDFELPSLSVEPLVENAVKHGIDRYSSESKVILHSFETDSAYQIEIKDNGKGFDLNEETFGEGGIGLKNAASRLKLLCGGALEIQRTAHWTVITITIPKE